MEGLKEWATVVKALEQGKQTVILRKGGILETASGFNIESKKNKFDVVNISTSQDYVEPLMRFFKKRERRS